MLSKADNEYLCRVGPGTPMGNLMRQYWLPAVRSDELPAPDCPPLRVRLLGEDLIAFRTTSGQVGLIQNTCPHRGASLFFGRNEEDGLRCVYHGWKFDVDRHLRRHAHRARRVQLQDQGQARSPTRRTSATASSGPTWARARRRRRCPTSKPTCSATDDTVVSIIHRPCNWMQGWEGEMDTVHPAFLHAGATRVEDTTPGTFDYYIARTPAPRFAVIDTAVRHLLRRLPPGDDDTYYWRIAHILFPFYAMIPAGTLGQQTRFARLRADGRRAHAALGDRTRPDGPGRAARRGARLARPARPRRAADVASTCRTPRTGTAAST